MNMPVNCADLQARLRDQWLGGAAGDDGTYGVQGVLAGELDAAFPRHASGVGPGGAEPAGKETFAPPHGREVTTGPGDFHRELPPTSDAVRRHLETCPGCRKDLESISRLDDCLRAGFGALANSIAAPAEERIARVLETLREEGFAVRRLRRLRRAVRLVLWSAFYGFALLAACLLATAVYRALLGG